ncbi:MAG: O-antigen ligase family protein [Bacteroidales bacterium]|nr:O-antigen ligase family protein [Bacteroidales bacterium]
MRGPFIWRLYLLTFSLLFLACGVRSDFLVDKSFLPRVLTLSVLLLIVWICRFRKKTVSDITLFTGAFAFLCGWSLLSAVWSIAPSEALMQSQLLFLSMITFLVILDLNRFDPAFEEIFIKTLLVVIWISFGLAFVKMALLSYYDPYKIISISANNNLYSGYLLLALGFIFTGYSRFRGFWKYLAAGTATGAFFFIIIIQSRAGYLGVIIAVLILLFLLLFRYRNLLTKQSLRITAASFAILGISLLIFYTSLDPVRRHYFLSKLPVWNYFVSYDMENLEALKRKRLEIDGLTGIPEFDFAESYYENANLRLIFWGKSIPLFLEHPLIGVGAGNWKLAVPSSPKPVNCDHTFLNYTYSQPHNELISFLTELGIPGLLLALVVFIFPLIHAYRRLILSPEQPPPEVLFFTAFITGFFLFSLFDFPLKRVEHNVLLFSAMAFLLYQVPMKPLNIPTLPGRIGKIVWLFVVLLLCSTIFLVTARIRGEYFTLKFFRNERRDDRAVIRYCREAESPFYKLTPNTLPVAWFEGVAHYRSGDLQQAKTCFETALTTTPFEVRVLNDYGITLYGLDNPVKAKSILLDAIAIDSCFDDAKFNLAAIYFHTGHPDSALFYIRGCRDSGKQRDFLEEIRSFYRK